MDNSIRCNQCRFYDIILGSYEKATKRGWCAKRSKYPAQEGPGQVFPPDVERVAVGQLAEPFVVRGGSIISACPFATPSDVDPATEKKTRTVVLNADGRRILS